MRWYSAEPPRTAVGSAVGSTVSAAVGSTVSAAVGSTVSAAVGSTVSAAVGSTVAAAAGQALRPGVGAAVRTTVLNAGHAVSPAVRRTSKIVETVAGTVRWFAHRSSVSDQTASWLTRSGLPLHPIRSRQTGVGCAGRPVARSVGG